MGVQTNRQVQFEMWCHSALHKLIMVDEIFVGNQINVYSVDQRRWRVLALVSVSSVYQIPGQRLCCNCAPRGPQVLFSQPPKWMAPPRSMQCGGWVQVSQDLRIRNGCRGDFTLLVLAPLHWPRRKQQSPWRFKVVWPSVDNGKHQVKELPLASPLH